MRQKIRNKTDSVSLKGTNQDQIKNINNNNHDNNHS